MPQTLLTLIEQVTTTARRLEARDGASARLVERNGAESLELRDAKNRLLFEYLPETGRCVLTVPEGDLALHAPRGNIDLLAGKDVQCQGRRIDLSASGPGGAARSSLSLEPETVSLSSGSLALAADRAQVLISEGNYQGYRLNVTVEQVKQVFERVETVATRIIERATDAYRQVENLSQLKAGRLRTLVKGACEIQGGRTSIKAESDVKIDGERINLG